MATIWTLASTKGGCGKTTLAMILASEIIRNGASVTLIDTDPNQPLSKIAQMGNLPDTLEVVSDTDSSGTALVQFIEAQKERPGFVIIDTEGTENIRAGLAMQMADLVIIPSKWSGLDKDEALKVVHHLKVAQTATGRAIDAVIVPSQVETTFETANTRQVRAELETSGIRVIDPPVLNKDAYRAMFSQGCLLHDTQVSPKSKSLLSARANAEAVARTIAFASNDAVKARMQKTSESA